MLTLMTQVCQPALRIGAAILGHCPTPSMCLCTLDLLLYNRDGVVLKVVFDTVLIPPLFNTVHLTTSVAE